MENECRLNHKFKGEMERVGSITSCNGERGGEGGSVGSVTSCKEEREGECLLNHKL